MKKCCGNCALNVRKIVLKKNKVIYCAMDDTPQVCPYYLPNFWARVAKLIRKLQE